MSAGTPLKRARQSLEGGGGSSWLAYDVDVLDSPHRRSKRFAAEAMSSELSSKLQVGRTGGCGEAAQGSGGGGGGSSSWVMEHIEGVPESMQCCSSSECSPTPTPQRFAPCHTPSKPGKPATSSALLASTLKSRLAPGKALQLSEQTPTSPSDPQLEGIDLRRATLMRMLLAKHGGGDGDMDMQVSPARPAQQQHQQVLGREGPSLMAASVSPMQPLTSPAKLVQPGAAASEEGDSSFGSPCSMEESPCRPPHMPVAAAAVPLPIYLPMAHHPT